VQEVEQTPDPIAEPKTPVSIPELFTGLVLVDVSAEWTAGQKAIDGVSLAVARGERVAIVGPSGSGKSTLAAVVMGFLPYAGSATLAGVELRTADGDDIRRHVGMLTQRAHIFDTSIADNVRIGNPAASDADVARVLDAAQLSSWVDSLPEGPHTMVGSFGMAISGGERQRIALARLLLARRPLVILDEPTEHLDGPTADALATTMEHALADATVLLITHRLIGLESFERIVVMRDGRAVAQGTYEELMAQGGWFAEHWRLEAERQDMAQLLPRLPVGRAVPGPLG
jgi:ABC-type transport system involved in cytochrome bd biosynthesis fused ATPase/permease subunit